MRRKIGYTWEVSDEYYVDFLKAMQYSNFAGPLIKRLYSVTNAAMLTSIMRRWVVIGIYFIRYKQFLGKPRDEVMLVDSDLVQPITKASDRWYHNWDSSLNDYENMLKISEKKRLEEVERKERIRFAEMRRGDSVV